MKTTGDLFERLVNIMAKLRDPNGGCPWDLEQTHKSITPYMIEEAYEVIDAIQEGDDPEFAKELGDLLLQVVFHAQMAKERNAFSIDQVLAKISEKLIRRHPHVFGDVEVNGADDVLKNWETIKFQERKEAVNQSTSALAGVPKGMPALLRAQRLGEKAAKVTFDWKTKGEVFQKVEEEIDELKVELKNSENEPSVERHQKAIGDEIGDLLFSLCQLSRWHGLRAEDCLREACDRFTARFELMEEIAQKRLSDVPYNELDSLWTRAKQELSKS